MNYREINEFLKKEEGIYKIIEGRRLKGWRVKKKIIKKTNFARLVLVPSSAMLNNITVDVTFPFERIFYRPVKA